MVDGNRIGPIGMARYCEEARMAVVAAIIGKDRVLDEGWKGFVRQCTIEMLAPLTFPETLVVGGGVIRIGKTSCNYGFGFFQQGVCVGLSDSANVWVNDQGRSTPISEAVKAVLQKEMLRS